MLEAARKARARRRSWPELNWRDWPGMAKAAAWWGRLSGRGRAGILAGVALVVAGGVTLGVVLSQPPAPRARQYLAFTACLLTDAHGLAGPQAAPAWAGMQDASLATHAKVEYLPVASGPTMADAAPFLASLAARQCKVVVAAGPAQAAAVAASARRYPAIRFAVVGGEATGANVTDVTGSASAVRSAVASLVSGAVAAAS
jgi:basic membrane lipoprotein Med (substrate-binding protein (PBP1-ABC) superfamily)